MYDKPIIPQIRARQNVLKDTTIREFSGGWNVVDNDLNLNTKFATVLDNMSREEDGSMGVRWGTQLFADIGVAAAMGATHVIINITYFQDRLITVLSDGRITATTAAGVTTVVWNTAIAGGLAGAPPGWGPTEFASFAVFNGKLIICNGTDKPLLMDFTNVKPVLYLADESGGSNINVPIARYVIAMNRYLVMAGDPQHTDRIHISNQNTSGTWYGDAPPNDATYVDVGKVGVQGDQHITGLNRYREQLVIGFMNSAVLAKLGIYDSEDRHVPDMSDVVEGYGNHSHRCMINLGNDLFMLDQQGVVSLAKSIYSGATEPKRVSELIDPEISTNISRLVAGATLLHSHAVYNSNDKQYMCFIPNHSEYTRKTRVDPFAIVRERPHALRMIAVAHRMLVGDQFVITGATSWNTIDADTQLNGVVQTVTRVINEDQVEFEIASLTTDRFKPLVGGGSAALWMPKWTETYGYIYTFVTELKIRAWARYRNWRWRASCRTELGNTVFADDQKLYLLGSSTNPVYSDFVNTATPQPIAFQWEMPWADFEKRVNLKSTRYIELDTRGSAQFTAMMFVDRLYERDGLMTPELMMTFLGGDNGGYGNNGQPYGGGRSTRDQRLYAWTARCNLAKLRFEGVTTEPLQIVAVSLLYQDGSIRR